MTHVRKGWQKRRVVVEVAVNGQYSEKDLAWAVKRSLDRLPVERHGSGNPGKVQFGTLHVKEYERVQENARRHSSPEHPGEDAPLVAFLNWLRLSGWRVMTHTDFVKEGAFGTIWVMDHPSGNILKGVGSNDYFAVKAIADQVSKLTGIPVPAMRAA